MTTWLITGSSSGLGRAVASAALAAGHNVVLTARNPDSLDGILRQYPATATAVPLDVTDPTAVRAAVRAAEDRFGGIDILVNNAGYGLVGAVEEATPKEMRDLFETNFFGLTSMITAALPGMRARRSGTIVNISSVGARIQLAGGGLYSASKAAVEALSGSLRKEVAELGIRVIVVEPGLFRTDFSGRSLARSAPAISDYDSVLRRDSGSTSSQRRGDPDRAALALIEAVTADEPPTLLLLGPDALEGFDKAQATESAEVKRFTSLTTSTDFIGRPT